jgi:hypothetical protein
MLSTGMHRGDRIASKVYFFRQRSLFGSSIRQGLLITTLHYTTREEYCCCHCFSSTTRVLLLDHIMMCSRAAAVTLSKDLPRHLWSYEVVVFAIIRRYTLSLLVGVSFALVHVVGVCLCHTFNHEVANRKLDNTMPILEGMGTVVCIFFGHTCRRVYRYLNSVLLY